jgi:hypothetical protein
MSAETMGPWPSSMQTAMGALQSGHGACWPITEGSWRVRDDGALALVGASGAEADVLPSVRPVDADEGGERNGFLHGKTVGMMRGRDMQSRTQRSQYGEPGARLSSSVRCGQRHTRWREVELASMACSTLNIRRRWVHVPHPFSPGREGMESGTVYPYPTLKPTRPQSLCSFGNTQLTPVVGQTDPVTWHRAVAQSAARTQRHETWPVHPKPAVASHQLLLRGLMHSPHCRLKAEATSKRSIDMEVPRVR